MKTGPCPNPADKVRLLLPNEAATADAAARIAPCIAAGMVVHLSGDLGAGKTTFCRALIRSLGYNGRVKSPTFTLVESYILSAYPLYHFDFYRFSAENELRDAGFEEQLDSNGVALVEWPEHAGNALPPPDLSVRLALGADADARRLCAVAFTDAGRRCLTALTDGGCCAPEYAPGSTPD